MPCAAVDDICPLERSLYQDVDGRGFQLEFTAPKVNAAEVVCSATITHPERGTVFQFDFSFGSGGYVQPFVQQRTATEDGVHHAVHFFDKDLQTTDPGSPAPPYLLIEGLGPADWYGPQGDYARRLPVGTPLWKLADCGDSPPAVRPACALFLKTLYDRKDPL